MAEFDQCAFLFARWKNLSLWRNLWTILLFVLGSAFTLFLIGAVLWFINESWIAGALSTVATIVNGVAVGWILTRRNQAVTEETEAKDELLSRCGTQSKVRLLSTHDEQPTISEVVENTERQLMLFGMFR